MKDLLAKVIDNRSLGEGSYLLSLELPRSFPTPKAGNFLMLSAGGEPEITLRRPMAFFDFKKTSSASIAKVLYASHGRGTHRLTKAKKGDRLSLLAPLGNAFGMPKSRDRTLIVAGGIGIAPFYLWWQQANATVRKNTRVVFGFRHKEQAKMADPFRSLKPVIALQEKARGYVQGNVLDGLRSLGDSFVPTRILTCGPNPMMSAVVEEARRRGIPCEVSLEAKMGCGMGVCLSCVTDFPFVAQSEDDRILLCQRGPVFTV